MQSLIFQSSSVTFRTYSSQFYRVLQSEKFEASANFCKATDITGESKSWSFIVQFSYHISPPTDLVSWDFRTVSPIFREV